MLCLILKIGFDSNQKSLGVHKILVRKIWFYPPPPKRAQNEEKLYKLVENPQNWHFFRGGGGGERNFMDKTVSWTSGRFWSNPTTEAPFPLSSFGLWAELRS